MNRAIVIGKFYPPHKGHHYLINYALKHADAVTVLVCDSPAYGIPAETRRRWLQTIHPTANVLIIPDLDDDDNSEAWAQHTIQFLGYAPDTVFSSEKYGITYAKYMHTKHVMVDHKRSHVPISATRIRNNMLEEWDYLDDVVKADVALRIVVVGAESTGTTTLSKALAEKFHTPWVPEYGRLYSEAFEFTPHEWTNAEFTHIAQTQQQFEKQAAITSQGVVVCDTNAFATTIWQDRYMGAITKDVAVIAKNDKATLYILTGDEIPFVQDGLRDGEHIRHHMHQRFIKELRLLNVPYILVTGSKEIRLETAFKAVAEQIQLAAVTQNQ